MILRELFENVTAIWARKGAKNVRKYRCTSGSRKGRIVAKPTTCHAPKRVSSSVSIKKNKRSRAGAIKVKTRRTRTQNAASRRLKSLNKRRR